MHSTEASHTKPASKIPALTWIESYFKGQVTHRFNGFGRSNDHSADYFDTRIHPESARTRACVSVEWAAFSEIAQDTKMIYVPGGISSGLRPHELLDKINVGREERGTPTAVTTYMVEGSLGSDVHRNSVIAPNKADNLRRAQIVRGLHPEEMVIAPVVREGAVRELTRTGAFTNWQRYEEEDYMAFWYPVIDRCKGMMLDGDWNYSRNTIWEMMRGVLIQAGEIPSRPRADMEVYDLDGAPVSLYARANKLAETLKYQLGKGFEPREAATALAQIFTLDENIRAGTIPKNGASMHPILSERPAAELQKLDALKAEIEPILLSHCAPYMRLDDLAAKYQEAAEATPLGLLHQLRDTFRDFANGVSAEALSILSVKPSSDVLAKMAKNTFLPQRQFDSYERFFEEGSKAKMFEDDWYGKLPPWERLALPFAIGATETGFFPAAHPMATMILTDLKRGKEGFRRAQSLKNPVNDMSVFAGAPGSGVADVIELNRQEAEALKAKLQKENPHKIVINTPSFLRIADTIEHFRKTGLGEPSGPERFLKRNPQAFPRPPYGFIAREGANETTPELRLALQMKFLDRNVDHAVFQEGWEHSDDLVQLRVRARLIQAGMVARPAGAQSPLHIVSAANPATPETLLEDIQTLTKEVKRDADTGVEAPEQALALARLVAMHELVVDSTLPASGVQLSRELLSPAADVSLTCYDRKEAREAAEQARTLLTEKAAMWIPRERLEEDKHNPAKTVGNRRLKYVLEAGNSLRGEEGEKTQMPPSDIVRIGLSGARR